MKAVSTLKDKQGKLKRNRLHLALKFGGEEAIS
jgi:hypothetical protein